MAAPRVLTRRLANALSVPVKIVESTIERVRQLVVDTKARIGEDRPRVVGSTESPEWLTSPLDVGFLRINWEHYQVLMGDAAGKSVRLSPEEPFDAVEFTCLGTSKVERISVTVEFEPAEGEPVERTTYFATCNGDTHDSVPFSVSGPVSESATVSVTADYFSSGGRVQWALSRLRDFKPPRELWITPPIPRPVSTEKPSVFYITVDAMRYGYLNAFESIVEYFGADAFVPSEPRTQGFWTRVAIASLFTGLHPGDHGHAGEPGSPVKPINPAIKTIGGLLFDEAYKCSAIHSKMGLLPEYNFADGFYRYKMLGDPSGSSPSLLERNWNSRTVIDQVIEWIDRDTKSTDSNHLFYYLHLDEVHYPYAPPMPGDQPTDVQVLREYHDRYPLVPDYVETVRADPPDVDPELLQLLHKYCRESADHIAKQIHRLMEYLRNRDLLDDSLIVIAGDHGEEFLERGFLGHNTLYDANLRPGMVIKFPSGTEVSGREEVDLIDMYPTIAKLVTGAVPSDCQGVALGAASDDDSPRFAERLTSGPYSISVERGDTKAIFTYPGNYPELPTAQQVADGPMLEEYYRLSYVRDGDYSDIREEISEDRRQELRQAAEEFALRETLSGQSEEEVLEHRETSSVREHLRDMGYLE